MYYTINKTTGRIDSVGIYPDAGIESNGSEPFTIYDAGNYRFDFETNTWIYDPIIMIPQSITRYQGMMYLYRIGRLKELEAKVVENDGEGEIAFYNSITWERGNPFVVGMAAFLSMTDADIDNFFIEAAKI